MRLFWAGVIITGALAWLSVAQGCAPRLRCHESNGLEVCERRECRDLYTGRFVFCKSESVPNAQGLRP